MNRAACVSYLRGGRAEDATARPAIAALLRRDPAGAAQLLAEAILDVIRTLPSPQRQVRGERTLGFMERALRTLVSEPDFGWKLLRSVLPMFLRGLPDDLRRLIPVTAKQWENEDYRVVERSFSVEFRAKLTAGSLRQGPWPTDAILDVLNTPEERSLFLDLVRAECPGARLDAVEQFEIERRSGRYSSIYIPVDQIASPEARLILLVEPDPAVRGALQAGLQRAGFLVAEVTNGIDGERFLDSAAPDAVVTELAASGAGLVAALKQRTPPLPVVAMSADATLARDPRVRDHPKMVFLKKPILFTPVMDALKGLLP